MKKKLLITTLLGISIFIVVSSLNTIDANSSLAPNGHTGSPADNSGKTCATSGCHAGSASATIGVLTSDIPVDGYVPGTTYNFTVSMQGASAYGFSVSPQTPLSSTGKGSLIAGTGTSVSTKYVRHSPKKTGASATWNFQWTAPTGANDTTVTFYGAFNFADNKGNSSGDIIKTENITYKVKKSNVGIEEKSTITVSVFPNPTNTFLNIKTDSELKNALLYSLDGKLVRAVSSMELSSKSIHVSDLDNGVYFIQAQTANNETLFSKFYKN